MLPKDIAKMVPQNRLMSEGEWRSIGIQQSQGWVHYMKHGPGICLILEGFIILFLLEPHIILFRRPCTKPS